MGQTNAEMPSTVQQATLTAIRRPDSHHNPVANATNLMPQPLAAILAQTFGGATARSSSHKLVVTRRKLGGNAGSGQKPGKGDQTCGSEKSAAA
jgi:hypothetical protein